MSFSAILQANVQFITGNGFGESVTYESWEDGILISSSEVNVLISDEEDALGFSHEVRARSDPRHILVEVSKADLATVHPQEDKLLWRGKSYIVQRPVSHTDPGAWRLYCVR